MNLHKSQVCDLRDEKQRKIDEIIEKNVNEERIRQMQKEKEKLQRQQEVFEFFLCILIKN